jgi:hypothetical protein
MIVRGSRAKQSIEANKEKKKRLKKQRGTVRVVRDEQFDWSERPG